MCAFNLLPTSMTLDDLERLKRHSCRNKIQAYEPTRKISMKIDLYYRQQNVGLSLQLLKICLYADNSSEFLGQGMSNAIHVTVPLRPNSIPLHQMLIRAVNLRPVVVTVNGRDGPILSSSWRPFIGRVLWFSAIVVILRHGRENQRTLCNVSI